MKSIVMSVAHNMKLHIGASVKMLVYLPLRNA